MANTDNSTTRYNEKVLEWVEDLTRVIRYRELPGDPRRRREFLAALDYACEREERL